MTTSGAAGAASEPTDQVAEGIQALLEGVRTEDVFRIVESKGDRTVLGISSIEKAGGFGFGSGTGVDRAGEPGGGEGGGGGGWGSARPVAIAEISSDGVRVWPVIDFTKLGLALVGVVLAIWRSSR